jgi:hypothetical protein
MYRLAVLIVGAGVIIAAPAAAQQSPATGYSQNGAQSAHPRAISQDEVRRDLQQAGFNNIEFLESAYVVRATNSNGTKLVMTITPESVRAIEVASPSGSAAPGSASGAPNSGPGITGQAGNKNGPTAKSSGAQADRQNSQQNEAVREQDSVGIPGKPGGKSGPAVNPPSGAPK